MRERTIKTLMIAYVSLFGALLFDGVAWPTHQVNIYGISYYLVHLKTFVPLALGFLICIALVVHVGRSLPRKEQPLAILRVSFFSIGVLMAGIMLTPYTWGTFFNWAHMTLGALLFVLQLGVSIWVTLRFVRSSLNWTMIVIQFVGGLLAMFSLPDNGINVLMQGEVIFQFGFAILLLNSIASLFDDTSTTQPARRGDGVSLAVSLPDGDRERVRDVRTRTTRLSSMHSARR
ncbi:MAG: hypothetical protein ACYCWN_04995 [Ferrimicrobium sp.]|jgi:hypothetical protein|uniref:Cytochrome b561 domain-containing protein n=1 Tax=Ferrimicrobium acidiphilum TaxID=121039 RepID=A0ABV3Y2C2_9ACTN|nr:hypothetical protein [Ferrimicrobium sp.]MCL5973322.1 hypothetical protein [Actinomycetota bacterium]